MDARNAIEAAMTNVFTTYDHLLRLLEDGALEELTTSQYAHFVDRFDQVQNRIAYVERQLLLALERRTLPAAG